MSEIIKPPTPPRIEFTKAEELKRRETERTKEALERVVAIVDDVLEEFGLGRPAQGLVEFLKDTSPYTILTRKLGVPAPGDVIDYIRYMVASAWRSLPPLIQKPPEAPEVRKLEE